jgi:hypothetical protein
MASRDALTPAVLAAVSCLSVATIIKEFRLKAE